MQRKELCQKKTKGSLMRRRREEERKKKERKESGRRREFIDGGKIPEKETEGQRSKERDSCEGKARNGEDTRGLAIPALLCLRGDCVARRAHVP